MKVDVKEGRGKKSKEDEEVTECVAEYQEDNKRTRRGSRSQPSTSLLV